MAPRVRFLVVFLLSLATLAASACSKASTDTASAPDEAALRADDRHQLERVITLDVRASKAMRDADDATRAGDAGAAAALVGERAAPAVTEALTTAEAAALRTEWGKAKRDELLAILRDRRTEMPKYAEAVKSGEPEKMLAAIEAQAAIERRALVTVAAVQAGR